jgi:hypothetical protein
MFVIHRRNITNMAPEQYSMLHVCFKYGNLLIRVKKSMSGVSTSSPLQEWGPLQKMAKRTKLLHILHDLANYLKVTLKLHTAASALILRTPLYNLGGT